MGFCFISVIAWFPLPGGFPFQGKAVDVPPPTTSLTAVSWFIAKRAWKVRRFSLHLKGYRPRDAHWHKLQKICRICWIWLLLIHNMNNMHNCNVFAKYAKYYLVAVDICTLQVQDSNIGTVVVYHSSVSLRINFEKKK
jgi:hypothetical protein